MSTLQARRFGTDVSNIPQDSISKTPLKKAPTSTIPKSTPKLADSQVDDVVQEFNSQLSLDTQSISEVSISATPFRYERDFLLSFKEFCQDKIEGLIDEVKPGFQPPVVADDFSMDFNNYRKKGSAISGRHRKSNSLSGIDIPFDGFSTPSGGAVFFKLDDLSRSSEDAPTSPPVSRTERAPMKFSKSAPVTPLASLIKDDPFGVDSQPITPLNLSLEWRIKKQPKKVKPRETDVRRLAARQKQIDIGMNTQGYTRFCELVPLEKRTKEHPRIPDIHQVCSKRSWDGQVRKWRRMLHDYDPESGTREDQEDEDLGSDNEMDDEVSVESNVARDEEESSHSIIESL